MIENVKGENFIGICPVINGIIFCSCLLFECYCSYDSEYNKCDINIL